MASTKSSKSAAKSLAEIKKQYKHLIEDLTADKPVEVISTGSLIINALLGERCQGVPRGRITEVCGPEASSKTTFAIHACAEAQKLGDAVAYLDFERTFDKYYAKDCGLNTDDSKFMLINPEDFETGSEMATSLIKTGELGLIVFDSVAAMTPKSEREGDGRSIGLLARLLSGFLGSFSKDLADTRTACIFVNQLRMKIPMNKFERPEEYSTGGKALQFYNTIKIRTQKIGIGKAKIVDALTGIEQEEIDRIKVRIDIAKNKLGRPFRRGEIWVKLGKGIDNVESIIEVAKGRQLITQAGPWYVLNFECESKKPGDTKFKGYDDLKEFLSARPNVQKHLLQQMDVAFVMSAEDREALEKAENKAESDGSNPDDTNGGPIRG